MEKEKHNCGGVKYPDPGVSKGWTVALHLLDPLSDPCFVPENRRGVPPGRASDELVSTRGIAVETYSNRNIWKEMHHMLGEGEISILGEGKRLTFGEGGLLYI